MISENKIKEIIGTYQCPGCVYGITPNTCKNYIKSKNLSCDRCLPGTREQDVKGMD